MSEHLSKTDWDRIRQFAETPMYERKPEMLLPDGPDTSEEDDS